MYASIQQQFEKTGYLEFLLKLIFAALLNSTSLAEVFHESFCTEFCRTWRPRAACSDFSYFRVKQAK
jgi:hypothetical protein